MPQFKDVRGVSWTAASEAVAQGVFTAIDHFLTYRADTPDRLDAVLEDDPECPAAWILKGFLLLGARSLSLRPKALDAHARAVSTEQPPNARESLLADALKAWAGGDLRRAQLIFDKIATQYPHDLLALRLQHINALFFGRPDVLRTSIMRTLSDWDDTIPGAGMVYGMACMGLEEVGDYDRAEQLGKRGVDLEPNDLWGVHSVAHVLEAQGRLEDGITWMQRPDDYWDGRNASRHHLWWHEALFMFDAAEYDRTIEYYDARLAPGATALGYLEMSNCSSLLFRLSAAGQDIGDRWETLLASSRHLTEDRALTFSDVHMIVALTMAREGTALKRMADDLAEYATSGTTFDQVASARLSVPLAKAMISRLSGDPKSATEILLDARFDFQHMGGSIAQRDMLDILVIDCALAAGRHRVARRLISEYRDARPHSVPMEILAQKIAA